LPPSPIAGLLAAVARPRRDPPPSSTLYLRLSPASIGERTNLARTLIPTNSEKIGRAKPYWIAPSHLHAIVTPELYLYLNSNLLEQEGVNVVKPYVGITSELLHKRRS
jgi:hypothetical protein